MVREKSPGLIRTIIDIIDNIITQYKQSVGKDQSKLQYIRDMEEFKSKVAGVTAQHLIKRHTGQAMPVSGSEFAAKTKAEDDRLPKKPLGDTMKLEESILVNKYSKQIDFHVKNNIREGIAENEVRELIQRSLWQLERDAAGARFVIAQGGLWDSSTDRGGNEQALPNARRTMAGDGGSNIIGEGITRELLHRGRVDLRGHKINNPGDLATLAQIYRSPLFETFRIIYIKENEIVAHEGITSRLPGSVYFIGRKNHHKFIYEIKDRMRRMGADGYYLLHNHPSGKSEPSREDVNATGLFIDKVPGCKGHVIINSNEYSTIMPDVPGRVNVQTHHVHFGEDRL